MDYTFDIMTWTADKASAILVFREISIVRLRTADKS